MALYDFTWIKLKVSHYMCPKALLVSHIIIQSKANCVTFVGINWHEHWHFICSYFVYIYTKSCSNCKEVFIFTFNYIMISLYYYLREVV